MNRRPGAVPNLPSSSVGSHAAPLRTASPYENPYGDVQTSQFAGGGMHQRTAADLEEQNDSRLDALSERIKMLKEVGRVPDRDFYGHRRASTCIDA